MSSNSPSVGRKKRLADLLHLQLSHISALENYKTEADKLCEMLWECKGRATTVLEQLELLLQRDREIEAHADYLRARKRLLHAAQLSSTNKSTYRAAPVAKYRD